MHSFEGDFAVVPKIPQTKLVDSVKFYYALETEWNMWGIAIR